MANDSIPQKRCSQCKKLLPATTEYYYKKENGLYGLYSHCKKCHYKYTSQKSIQWAKDHPERTREISRKFVDNHYEDELKRGRKYRENNREKTRMKSRLWLQENHLKHRIKEQRRRARKSNAEGTFSKFDIEKIYSEQNGKCAYCKCELNGKFHIDHIRPLARGGTNWPDNLACTCAECNLSKGDKQLDEWIQSRGW